MLAKEIEIVGLVTAAEAWVLYVLLVLLLWVLCLLLLLRHGAWEMCEGVGKVMAWKAAPVRRHGVDCVFVWPWISCRVRLSGGVYIRIHEQETLPRQVWKAHAGDSAMNRFSLGRRI